LPSLAAHCATSSQNALAQGAVLKCRPVNTNAVAPVRRNALRLLRPMGLAEYDKIDTLTISSY
jgi:hypothetical protein